MTAATEKLASRSEEAAAQPAVARLSRSWTAALVAGDVIAFSLSAWASVTLVEFVSRMRLDNSRLALSTFVYVALWLWLFKRLGLYERSFARTIQDEIYATIAAMALGIAPQLILFTIVPSISSSRLVLLVALGFSIASVTAVRAVAYRTRQIEATVQERRIALVGDADRLRAAREELGGVPNTHVLAIPVENLDLAMATQGDSLESFEAAGWFSKALRWECDTIVFTDVPDPRHVPGLLAAARKWGLQIAFAPPRIRAYAYRFVVDTLGHQALIVPRPIRAASSSTRFVKRAIDVAIAGTLGALTLPLLFGCALVLASSDRPVLTRETRVGRGGRPFTLLTFTTAVPILRELPSLLNVLRGEMSIVGPRAHDVVIAEALRAYNPRYSERTLVAPGLTGWAQVNDCRGSDERELAYDLFYLENWGLFVDAYIAVKAIAAVAVRIGAGVKTSA